MATWKPLMPSQSRTKPNGVTAIGGIAIPKADRGMLPSACCVLHRVVLTMSRRGHRHPQWARIITSINQDAYDARLSSASITQTVSTHPRTGWVFVAAAAANCNAVAAGQVRFAAACVADVA